jgi:predicted house-cleaning noncanonical NTP pyrophosphatase (MazG superfamily)
MQDDIVEHVQDEEHQRNVSTQFELDEHIRRKLGERLSEILKQEEEEDISLIAPAA